MKAGPELWELNCNLHHVSFLSIHTYFLSSIVLCLGVLATEGVEIESFSAPADRSGDLWYCVGVSSLLRDLSALNSVVKDAAQLTF